MTRCHYLLALLAFCPPAHAGESFSFTVAGHRIHIEAPRHCNSASCVAVSIPGIYQSRRTRDRYDDVDAAPAPAPVPAAAPAKPPVPVAAPQPVMVRPIVPPAAKITPEAVVAAPSPDKPVACAPQEAGAPRPQAAAPSIAPPVAAPVAPVVPPVAPPPVVTRPAPEAPPRIIKVENEQPATTPLGDWQTEGRKGSVRIEQCGQALCGYVLESTSNSAGESVLINMKPKADSAWSGNIYSRDSKNTYYATIAMQGPNSLRVEACAFGRFFCTGNVWSRIESRPERLIISRQIVNEPRT